MQLAAKLVEGSLRWAHGRCAVSDRSLPLLLQLQTFSPPAPGPGRIHVGAVPPSPVATESQHGCQLQSSLA